MAALRHRKRRQQRRTGRQKETDAGDEKETAMSGTRTTILIHAIRFTVFVLGDRGTPLGKNLRNRGCQ